MEPLFLTLDEVLEIHSQQIELYGGRMAFAILRDWNQRSPRPWRLSAGSSYTRPFHRWPQPTCFTSARTTRSWTATSGPARTLLSHFC